MSLWSRCKWRKLRTSTARAAIRYRGVRQQRFRVRVHAASGVTGSWRTTKRRC